MRREFPGLYVCIAIGLCLFLVFGCASPPPADDKPVVVIWRQYFLVPVQPNDYENCGGIEECWYVEPTDEDYGPI